MSNHTLLRVDRERGSVLRAAERVILKEGHWWLWSLNRPDLFPSYDAVLQLGLKSRKAEWEHILAILEEGAKHTQSLTAAAEATRRIYEHLYPDG